MSEVSSTSEAPQTEAEPLFGPAELEEFDAADTQAGKAIGTMLSWFFVYTIIAMSVAAYWTWSAIQSQ